MKNTGFVEPIGPIGMTASQAISVLGGSSDRIAAHLEWQKECSGRRYMHMPREQQREVFDLLMTKIAARDYTLLNHSPAGGIFTDIFQIVIRNKNNSLWHIRLMEWDLQIMPEDSPSLLWFEGLEPRIIGICFPHSRRLIRIVDYLRSQV